jgi:PAS domain S-box-containing protein
MRVLYVEDDCAYSRVLIDVFARTAPHIELDWVESLAGAKAKLRDFKAENPAYDILLTDMQLPDGNGISLLPYLQQRGIRLPVVVVTGAGNEDAVIAALKSGASDYLVKGGDCLGRLPSVLETACRRYQEEIARSARHLRVLYIEHNIEDAELTRRQFALSAPFIDISVIDSGEQALERLESLKEGVKQGGDMYDVILIDYRLPGMSSLELMKELKEVQGIESPVVFVTGQGDEESALLTLRLGAADYVVKSQGYLNHLALVVENAYNKARAEREHEALKSNEKYFRSLIENASDVIAVVERSGVILYGSPSVERVLGLTSRELAGTNCFDLIHAEDREIARRAFGRKALSPEGIDRRVQIRVRHKNGSWRYLEAAGLTRKNESAQTVIVTNLRDITDRKEAEQRLIESEERYRTVIEHSNDGIVLGKGGIHIYVNQRFLEMFGFERPEDAIGKPVTMVVHPDDAERVIDINLKRQRGEDAPSRYEFKGIRRDGTVVDIEVSVAGIVDRGEVTSLAFLRDVTARKRAEEALRVSEDRYRRLFSEATEGIVLTDRQTGNILDCNEAFLLLTGYERNDLIGRSQAVLRGREISYPESQDAVFRDQMTTKSGTVREVEIKDQLFNLDGVEVVQGFFRDITEERRGQRERETSLALMQLLNDQNLTHELVRSLLRFFQKWTGCEAVGIRLREDEDFPYYETSGFSADFVEAERHLCERDLGGQIIRDNLGNPILECMCGNVLSGRFDPKLPFFTLRGSFWTNCTTKLLATTSEAERQARTRNRCNGEGYESVVLIPLRQGTEVLGLLQLNDHRAGLFTPEMISFLESACEQIAIALAQRQSQAALKVSEQRFRDISDAAGEYVFEIDREGCFTFASDRITDVTGYGPEEVLGRKASDFLLPSGSEGAKLFFSEQLNRAAGFRDLEIATLAKSGGTVWLNITAVPTLDGQGAFVGYRGAALDITARKLVEEKMKASLKEKEVLLREIHHRVKNNLQVIASLLKLQSSYFKDTRTREAFKESQSRIRTIALVHQKLYQSEDLSKIDFASYVEDLSRDLFRVYGVDSGRIELAVNVSEGLLDIDTAMPCGLIISELLSNSLKYAFVNREKGRIFIDLTSEDGRFVLRIGDDGAGLPDRVDFKNTETLGLQLLNILVEQLDGTIEPLRGPGTGFVITFKG